MGLRPLACWDCGFESRRGHGCLSLLSVVCWQVEVSASDWSLVQRSPTECGVSECDREASVMRPCPNTGCCAIGKKIIIMTLRICVWQGAELRPFRCLHAREWVGLCVCACVRVVCVCMCARTHTHTPDDGLGKQGDVIRVPQEANTFRI
jgi:hypothetical protein